MLWYFADRRRRQPTSIRGLDFVLAFCYFFFFSFLSRSYVADGQFYLYANYFIVASEREREPKSRAVRKKEGEARILFVGSLSKSPITLLAHIFQRYPTLLRRCTSLGARFTMKWRERLRDSRLDLLARASSRNLLLHCTPFPVGLITNTRSYLACGS